jgi:hypothetical protein
VSTPAELPFDPTREIAIVWNISDVHDLASGLSDEQALQVLHLVAKEHDGETGVTYSTIDNAIDDLFGSIRKDK